MEWNFEVFKYGKMGKKGVPFGYLGLSRAFGKKSCPRAADARAQSPSLGAGADPVRFFLDRATRVLKGRGS